MNLPRAVSARIVLSPAGRMHAVSPRPNYYKKNDLVSMWWRNYDPRTE